MRLFAAACLNVLLPALASAQSPAAPHVGRNVTAIQIAVEGVPSNDPALADLVENEVGRPLSMHEVRETIAHLFSLGRYEDVRVEADANGAGVGLRYNLIPVHAVERVEFTGALGLSKDLLEQTIEERFGREPPVGRAADMVRLLTQTYEDHGYRRAVIAHKTTELHNPDRTILTFEIAAGPRARIGRVDVAGDPLEAAAGLLRRIGAVSGAVYQPAEIEKKLAEYVADLKDDRRYDAVASLRQPVLSEDGTVADLTIDVRPGPVVTLAFDGDPIPEDRRDALVPIEREGSADEDLLEDSTRRIEEYLRQQGYWRARATFERQPANGQMRIVFTVRRGLQYRIAAGVELRGNRAIGSDELRALAPRLGPADLYMESHLTSAASAIAALYRKRGYAEVKVDASEIELNPVRAGEGLITPVITIAEGPLTLVGSISFDGNVSAPEPELRQIVQSKAGSPYFEQAAAADQDSVLLHYYNLGFASATVTLHPRRSDDGSRVDLEFRINEGPRSIVDHIIIVGNRRTDPDVIRRELRLKPGEPLGLGDRMESQRRLGALGLFRRVSVQPLTHGAGHRQDVLVTVEEAPATSIGYGGGFEVSRLLRPTGPSGKAEERFELAPRGFFDIGRRNLWGKNRSVNLFTRFGLRPDDSAEEPGGSRFGFADYRVVATYREPRMFGANDATITGALEQGVRSSFNFERKGVTAELNRRVGPGIRAAARYSFGTTQTFDKGPVCDALDQDAAEPCEQDENRRDRLFPPVRLSSFSGAISHDTRDDVVEPSRGAFLSVEGSVAARALGGQVGFLKSYVQAFWFRRVPGTGRVVFAGRAALGVANGFPHLEQATDARGEPIPDTFVVTEQLPASERFFAGGDTTVRGFALDTLGEPRTFSPSGFPRGGDAVTILNAELRLALWRQVGAVVFLDGGNVFERVAHFDLSELRGAAGFGLRYRSPVGPVRLDVGFKMDRRRIGQNLESPRAIHLSIGHAF